MIDSILDQHLRRQEKAYDELVERAKLEEKMEKVEKVCETEGCGFPASECLIPDHPQLCGECLERWFLEICKRVDIEQRRTSNVPDELDSFSSL